MEIEFVKVFGEVLGKLEIRCVHKGRGQELSYKIVGRRLLGTLNLISL